MSILEFQITTMQLMFIIGLIFIYCITIVKRSMLASIFYTQWLNMVNNYVNNKLPDKTNVYEFFDFKEFNKFLKNNYGIDNINDVEFSSLQNIINQYLQSFYSITKVFYIAFNIFNSLDIILNNRLKRASIIYEVLKNQ